MPLPLSSHVFRQGRLHGLMHPRRALIVAGRRYSVSNSTTLTPAPPKWEELFPTSTIANLNTATFNADGMAQMQLAGSANAVADSNTMKIPATPSRQEFSGRDVLEMARTRPLPDLMVLLTSLINEERVEMASILFHSLGRYHGQEWEKYPKTQVVNQFLLAHIERGDWVGVLQWRDVFKTGDPVTCAPDAYSFGLLLRFCVRNSLNGVVQQPALLEAECRKLFAEAAMFGISQADILGTAVLSPSETSELKSVKEEESLD